MQRGVNSAMAHVVKYIPCLWRVVMVDEHPEPVVGHFKSVPKNQGGIGVSNIHICNDE